MPRSPWLDGQLAELAAANLEPAAKVDAMRHLIASEPTLHQMDVLGELAETWQAHPEWRFGQLVDQAITVEARLFAIPDDQIVAQLRKLRVPA